MSPGVGFKDGILSRSSCLEALVLRSGRHSSLPCSCTSCVALAVLAGKAFELFQTCFESPRRKDISFLRHTFKYCVCHLAKCKWTSGPEGPTTSPSYSIHVSILESRGLLPVADFSSQSCKPCTGVLTSHAGMWNSSHAVSKKVRPNS